MRGRLITIEGLDGAGKTTLAASLTDVLRERGVPVELLREPGGVVLAERLRELVKDPSLRVDARAEALIYAAARAQLVEERCCRCWRPGRGCCSTGSSTPRSPTRAAVAGSASRRSPINRFAVGGLVPDRTLLLRIDPQNGRARQAGRGEAPDRLEREGEDFFAAIALTYEDLAALDPERIRPLDAAQRPDEVLVDAIGAISDLLP